MKCLVISPGKKHDPVLADAITVFETRLGKRLLVGWYLPPAGTKESEGAAIQKQLAPGDFVVLLDERGGEVTSEGFAELLRHHLEYGTKRLVFIIGGAFGVSDAVRDQADLVLSLSRLVFPHMLVRLVLVEQLYRAVSIIDGSKYHHA